MDDAVRATGAQAAPQVAAALRQRLVAFLLPLSLVLDERIDRRLVRTFVATVEAMIRWRNRAHGLLLSELGGYLLAPEHAPAGTKRLSNLLRSPRWLVVARRGAGQEPWYLLTTERVETVADAWRVVLIYARRWQLETTWRYGKSELAMESPRLWTWERREKLLLLATLAYTFLLTLLDSDCAATRQWLLRFWCHRTGKRSRKTPAPLYRIRSALSRLWQDYRPPAPLFTYSR